MDRRLTLILLAAALPAAASAADMRLIVTDAAGRPLPDAVVSAYPATGVRPALRPGGPYRMVQQDVAFRPFVLIVPVGATVAFPNLDRFRHQVYSFSASKRFELKLYGRDGTHSVLFDRAGTVAIGCNIHDAMSAFIRVVDTPFAARTAENGQLMLTGIAPGTVRLRVWHPRLKGRANERELQVSLPPAGLRQTVAVPVRAG